MNANLHMKACLPILALLCAAQAHAQDSELAKKAANPVSNMISVPLQNNWDCCYGPEDATKYTLNLQPVIPFSLGDNWNLITRTIIPYVNRGEAYAGKDDANGLGDVTQSFFFSPKSSANGVTWGIGPVFLWPTGARGVTAGQYGLGPTMILLKQDKGLTYGFLASQTWTVGGKSTYDDVNVAFLQPFASITMPDTTSYGVNLEASYDWEQEEWSVPINFTVSHIFRFGKQPVSLGLGGRYYLSTPEGGPDWGVRVTANFLFPEG